MNQSVELILTGRADVSLNAETAFYDFMKNQPDQAVKIGDVYVGAEDCGQNI